jgi:hypothetical protein
MQLMSRQINSLVKLHSLIASKIEIELGKMMAGGENTIVWSSNRARHFVCLELLILLVVESRKHTISIYIYLRSDGVINREEKRSSRRLLSRMARSQA